MMGVTNVGRFLAHLPLKDGKPPAIEASIMGRIGHAVEPVIRPLGFNWKINLDEGMRSLIDWRSTHKVEVEARKRAAGL